MMLSALSPSAVGAGALFVPTKKRGEILTAWVNEEYVHVAKSLKKITGEETYFVNTVVTLLWQGIDR